MKKMNIVLKILLFSTVLEIDNSYANEREQNSVILNRNIKNSENTDDYLVWDSKKLQEKIKRKEDENNRENEDLKSQNTCLSKNTNTKRKRINQRIRRTTNRGTRIISKAKKKLIDNVKLKNNGLKSGSIKRQTSIIKCKNNDELLDHLNKNTCNNEFSEWNKKQSLELRIINRDNRIPNNIRPELRELQGKQVNTLIYDDLNKMIEASSKKGLNLRIVSCYRSYQHQKNLLHAFARNIKRRNRKMTYSQALAMANRRVALPGASEHNLGIAVDFGNGTNKKFVNTKEYQWMKNNAYKFGFIERYKLKWRHRLKTIYEPWHFRYVGKNNAEEIEKSGLCLEDFVRQKIGQQIITDNNDNELRTLDDSLNDLFKTLEAKNIIDNKEKSNNNEDDKDNNMDIDVNIEDIQD